MRTAEEIKEQIAILERELATLAIDDAVQKSGLAVGDILSDPHGRTLVITEFRADTPFGLVELIPCAHGIFQWEGSLSLEDVTKNWKRRVH